VNNKRKCVNVLQNHELATEWHHFNNGDLKPQDVTLGSLKMVWWQCKRGHEWEARIYSRG